MLPELAELLPNVDEEEAVELVCADIVSVTESVSVEVDVMPLADPPAAVVELAGAGGKPVELPETPVLMDTPVLSDGVGKGAGPYPRRDELEAGTVGPAEDVPFDPVTGDSTVLLEVVCSPVRDWLLPL